MTINSVNPDIYSETVLKFWVEQGNCSQHTFYGQLLKTRGGVVGGVPVKVYINDTLYETYTTDGNGRFHFTRNFDSEETQKPH